MGRSVLADENLQEYIKKFAKPNTCTIGLMLGQPTPTKDYIIHLARTPAVADDEANSGDLEDDTSENSLSKPKSFTNMSEVIDFWVADHAKHATRMLPGGMYVLGIFVVSDKPIFTTYDKKIRSILTQMQTQLAKNSFLFATPDFPERLILNYSMNTNDFKCQTLDVLNGGMKPADFKFQSHSTKWHQLECKYELKQTFSIPMQNSDWALKKHMKTIIERVNGTLMNGVFLFDGEIKSGDEVLESVSKKKKIKGTHHAKVSDNQPQCTQISIYVPCENYLGDDEISFQLCAGEINVSGQVSCRIWLHPKMTLDLAKQCVVEDLMRSLTARLEMHWDTLIEEEHGSPEDTNSFHEPPRRVMVPLPQSVITFSDYLFPGEGSTEAMISLQDLLDIKVTKKDDIVEVEGQADLNDLYPISSPANTLASTEASEEILPELTHSSNSNIYLVGIGIAILVLIVSLLINYIQTR